jgi:PKD repeat protein
MQNTFSDLAINEKEGSVVVRITANDVAALRPLLQARGFKVISDQSKLHFIEGSLPLSQLAPGTAGISALTSRGLLGVKPVHRPMNNVGRVQNQADYLLEANRVRAAMPTGYNGAGQRIGVISDSYNSLNGAAAGIASGDLPANVQVIKDIPNGTDEGRGMLELVYDIAPAAGLAFSTAYETEGDFATQIRRLADPAIANCKIIVDDISYYEEPFFQDGVVAQAVEEVTAQRGVAYFSSAGNQADYSSEYVAPVFAPATNGAAELNFNPTGTADTRQRITIARNLAVPLVLQWSDPFYTTDGVKTDLDLYLLSAAGDTVARSADSNLASQTPSEFIFYTNTTTGTTFDLVVRRRAGTANPARVKYISFATIGITEYWTRSGTIFGHHAAVNAGATAAAPSYNRLTPETFTSKGSPTILFAPNGTPLATPVTRPKPEFTSIDGVSTTFFGQLTPDPKDGSLFFGTSAAAPNAAAVAALLWQARPSLTPVQLKAQLAATATDLNTPGFDELTGAGLINAYRAIFGNPVAAATPFTETFDSQGLRQAWEIQGRGAARTLVRSDYNPASAPGQLVLDAIFPYFTIGTGTSEADLHLNLASAPTGGFVLTFRQKKFAGETDEVMPATFTTTSATDGVAISVNGTTWYRLVDLTGTAATTDYQTVSVNLSQVAQTLGLTLGADTRIRFQRFGRGQVDPSVATRSGGRAFDDVLVTGPTASLAPVPLFTSSVPSTTTVCPGTTVQFQNTSLFGATSFLWSFPGGTPSTSTLPNPTVTYAAGGSYAVTLQVTNANGTATRTVSNVINVSTAPPAANFTVRQTPICPGGQITFTNTSTQCPVSYSWSLPGATPSTSTAASPTVVYNTAGDYTATLTATGVNGTSTKSVTVRVQTATPIPFAENFTSGIPGSWTVLNPDNSYTWTAATNVVRKDGSRGPAVLMPFFDYSVRNRRDSLQTPTLDLRNQAQASLHFDLAYAPINNTYNDSLAVDVYAACTTNRLGRVYLKSAAAGLGTVRAQPDAMEAFAPTAASQWRQEDVNLSAYINQQVYLRFIAFNQFGNDLYLSNVRVDNTVLATRNALAESPALQVYPNPVQGGATLTLQLPAVKGLASVQLVDGVGRTCWQTKVELNSAAATSYNLSSIKAAGIYVVLCQTADGQLFSRRVVVQ